MFTFNFGTMIATESDVVEPGVFFLQNAKYVDVGLFYTRREEYIMQC